jgi:hypothetical protein
VDQPVEQCLPNVWGLMGESCLSTCFGDNFAADHFLGKLCINILGFPSNAALWQMQTLA